MTVENWVGTRESPIQYDSPKVQGASRKKKGTSPSFMWQTAALNIPFKARDEDTNTSFAQAVKGAKTT